MLTHGKSYLIEAAASVTKTRASGEAVLAAVLEHITAALLRGEAVRLPGIGKLEPTTRGARKGTAPNGEAWESAPAKTVRFGAAKAIKERLNPTA